MNWSKSATQTITLEVIENKPSKGNHWLIPVWGAESEMNPEEINSIGRYWNKEGSVCVKIDTMYKVYRNNEEIRTFIKKDNAIKYAQSILDCYEE